MNNWKIQLASLPDKRNLVAEIWYADELWAEISHEEDAPWLEIYPRRGGESWHFDLDQAIKMLAKAKQRLADIDIAPGFGDRWSMNDIEPR